MIRIDWWKSRSCLTISRSRRASRDILINKRTCKRFKSSRRLNAWDRAVERWRLPILGKVARESKILVQHPASPRPQVMSKEELRGNLGWPRGPDDAEGPPK